MRQSDKPDPRHKTWECKQPISRRSLETCDTLNNVELMTCRMCGYKINGVEKVRAMDENNQHIGNLYSHDYLYGITIWEYFE